MAVRSDTSLSIADCLHLNSFPAAALSITTLYRSSRQTSRRAYNAGYGAACQDLLLMIQQGVSVGGDPDPSFGSMSEGAGNGMTIGKVMDWIEARLEAVKSREEEEDEEEEKERAKNGAQSSASTSKPSGAVKSRPAENVSSATRPKELVCLWISIYPKCLVEPNIISARITSSNPSNATYARPTYSSNLFTSLSFHIIGFSTCYALNTPRSIHQGFKTPCSILRCGTLRYVQIRSRRSGRRRIQWGHWVRYRLRWCWRWYEEKACRYDDA